MEVKGILAAVAGLSLLGAGSPCDGTGASAGFPMVVTGQVTDRAGTPLGGVRVKLFVEGVVGAETRTDPDGAYLLEFSIDPQRDETVVVCWIAPRTDLVSEFALIRESEVDRRIGLWSPCVPRLGVSRNREWSVRLRGPATVREELSRSTCLR